MSELESRRRLLAGMGAIADYYGLPKPKANRLAAQGLLPGVFKMGRSYFLDQIVAAEQTAAKARGAK